MHENLLKYNCANVDNSCVKTQMAGININTRHLFIQSAVSTLRTKVCIFFGFYGKEYTFYIMHKVNFLCIF